MKRTIALLLSLLLFSAAALADNMIVVNCNEWVSLRKTPSTASERLKKVPLYDMVWDCEWAENGFVRCTYQDVTGYIQAKYLDVVEPNEMETLLDETFPQFGMNVLATRQYSEGERLVVTGCNSSGAELWSYGTETDTITELTSTDAFIGGTAEDPRVMVYNSDEGLYCLDLTTGDELWHLDSREVRLGASLSHALDADGTLYIAGYYGPDPVCIDVNGHVRWQSSAGSDDIFWPYEIRIEGRGIVTQYAMMDSDKETEGRVIYDRTDGHVVGIEYD